MNKGTREIGPSTAGMPEVMPRTPYRKRVNMGSCPPVFGKIIVFVALVESSYKREVFVNP
jgi:hypothetical protein